MAFKTTRKALTKKINEEATDRRSLEGEHGQVWNTTELSEQFTVLGFMAPMVVVRRKSDGVKGTLLFQHMPRFYFRFEEE